MPNFGLSKEALIGICNVFADYKKITEVRIFGSRALNRHHEGSDIDLAIYGDDLTLDDLLNLRLKLEDLMLPYQFDLVDINKLAPDDKLLDHIKRVGIAIFHK